MLNMLPVHFLFEIDLGLRIVFVSIFYFLVSFVDQMVASCDMVMTIVLNAFD